jgi:hypothetical protein
MGKGPATDKLAFVITAARFIPGPTAKKSVVEIDVQRNLSLETEIDELYFSYILREQNNHPGYYGDVHWRRTDADSAPELIRQEFTCRLRVMPVTTEELPGGPTKPDDQQKHWFDVEYRIKPPKPAFSHKDFMFIALSLEDLHVDDLNGHYSV